jgi:hypothetical protein
MIIKLIVRRKGKSRNYIEKINFRGRYHLGARKVSVPVNARIISNTEIVAQYSEPQH